jgi:hypothetical protein
MCPECFKKAEEDTAQFVRAEMKEQSHAKALQQAASPRRGTIGGAHGSSALPLIPSSSLS